MRNRHLTIAAIAMLALGMSVGCGGGGGGSSTPPPTQVTPPPAMAIATTSLPYAVQGVTYSTTLKTNNGTAPFTWRVDASAGSALPIGLNLDRTTGVLSGTPTQPGYFSLVVVVSDSGNPAQTATHMFPFGVDSPFSVSASPWNNLVQYQAASELPWSVSGGVAPYQFSLTQGTLPPGMSLAGGSLTGAPSSLGTYSFTIQVQDSYFPPEKLTQPITLTVTGFPLTATWAEPSNTVQLNRPFCGHFVINGGTPPYNMTVTGGSFPPGLSLSDPSTFTVSGTPIRAGGYTAYFTVKDSSNPQQFQYGFLNLSVVGVLGRNDTPATATSIGNGQIQASLSPVLDSAGNIVPDTDYYKLIAAPGSIVHVETFVRRNNPNSPLDSVIQLTDVNGAQLTTGCNPPGATTTDYSSACLDDDIDPGIVQDSVLDYKVPGTTSNQSFLVHVLDWSGSSRPDMIYALSVSGVVEPLKLFPTNLVTGVVGLPYQQMISPTGGTQGATVSIPTGLPPGLTYTYGSISGTPTTAGHYAFAVKAMDSGTPQQQITATMTIDVANPLVITTSSLPSGTAGVSYSYQITSTGGLGPIVWTSPNVPSGMSLTVDGVLSGVPSTSGTYPVTIIAADGGAYQSGESLPTTTLTLTVN